MTDHIHPSDKADALKWAVSEIALRAPQGGLTQEPERSRYFILKELAQEAQREARR